ncbi:MAG: GNAT family N-acetyltransferase [Bacteroidetes bacterium]|nr:GNAT family N-acetyltransferase [Bacteroidota bacterium]
MISIRRSIPSDFDALWEIFHQVVKSGDTYVFHPDTNKKGFKKIWFGDEISTYTCICNPHLTTKPGQQGLASGLTNISNMGSNEKIIGTFILKPNYPGLGSHIANLSLMLSKDHQEKGIGKTMVKHAFTEAKKQGYKAIQLNMVVSTNKAAVSLAKSLGFKMIGRLPEVFKHQKPGYVDAFVMHRFL